MQQQSKSRAYRAAVGSILTVMLALGSYATIPVYVVPLSEALSVSVGQISLLFTFSAVGGLITSLTFGTMLKKLQVKRLVCLSGVALAAFFIIVYFTKSVTLLYIGAVIYGFSTTAGGYAVAQTVITLWFAKNRGKIISFLNIGLGLIGLVLAPLLASALENFGVRSVALVQGLVTGVLMIINAVFLLQEHPGKYGLQPYGYDPAAAAAQTVAAGASNDKGMGLKQIVSSGPFWLILLACALVTAAQTGFTNNASAFYQSIGLTSVQAALCISVYSGVKLAWSPLFGTLTDKKGPGFATLICGGISAVILTAGTILTGYTGAITIAALIGALNFGGMLGAVCFPRIYGTKEAANMVGFASAASSVGAMIGAPIAGFIYDATQSYSPFLLAAAAMTVLGIVFTMAGSGKRAVAKIQEKTGA